MCGSPGGPREQTLRLKFSVLGVFLALMTESSHTTSHYYPKYEVWAVENSLWWDPFNVREERLPCLVLIFCSAQAAAVVAEAVKCGFCINASFAVSGLPEHCPIFAIFGSTFLLLRVSQA